MNGELQRKLDLPLDEALAEAATAHPGAAASAEVVKRTHRIVHERAKALQARRSLVRSLWLPLALFSGFLIVICTALWAVLEEYDILPSGIVDSSQQMFVLMIWCLPLSAVLLALVLSRRFNAENGSAK